MRRWLPLIALTLTTAPLRAEPAAAQVFDSGDARVDLLELYTSEGCSSCPPADRWLSRLKNDERLWIDYVPVAFHVDYWDYLGWPDRFADADFSARQRRYFNEGAVGTVYTPGVFADGSEWTGWRRVDTPRAGQSNNAGVLTATVQSNRAVINFATADATAESLVAHVALLGLGITSEVSRGENRGRTLTHDFVVLGTADNALDRTDEGYATRVNLPVTGHAAERYALAVWVSAAGSQQPLQATGGFLSP